MYFFEISILALTPATPSSYMLGHRSAEGNSRRLIARLEAGVSDVVECDCGKRALHPPTQACIFSSPAASWRSILAQDLCHFAVMNRRSAWWQAVRTSWYSRWYLRAGLFKGL